METREEEFIQVPTINPSKADAEQQRMISDFIKAHPDQEIISGDVNIKFEPPLIKFEDGYYAQGELITKGSTGTKILKLEVSYKKDQSGEYTKSTDSSIFVKRIELNMETKSNIQQAYYEANETRLASDQVFKELKEMVTQERDMLAAYGDSNAEIALGIGFPKTIYFKMTKVEGVSLQKYLDDNPDLPFEERLKLAKLIGDEIKKLHEAGMSHLDLNPRHIFIDTSKGETKLRLIDFGSAQTRDANLADIQGHRHRTSPEFDPFDHKESTPVQVDNFSLAHTLKEVFGDRSRDRKLNKFDKVSYFNDLTEDQKRQMQIVVLTLQQLGDPDHTNRDGNFNAIFAKIEKNFNNPDTLTIIETALDVKNKPKKLKELVEDDKVYQASAERMLEFSEDPEMAELITYHQRYKNVTRAIQQQDVATLMHFSQQQLRDDRDHLVSLATTRENRINPLGNEIHNQSTRVAALKEPNKHMTEMYQLFDANEFTMDEKNKTAIQKFMTGLSKEGINKHVQTFLRTMGKNEKEKFFAGFDEKKIGKKKLEKIKDLFTNVYPSADEVTKLKILKEVMRYMDEPMKKQFVQTKLTNYIIITDMSEAQRKTFRQDEEKKLSSLRRESEKAKAISEFAHESVKRMTHALQIGATAQASNYRPVEGSQLSSAKILKSLQPEVVASNQTTRKWTPVQPKAWRGSRPVSEEQTQRQDEQRSNAKDKQATPVQSASDNKNSLFAPENNSQKTWTKGEKNWKKAEADTTIQDKTMKPR